MSTRRRALKNLAAFLAASPLLDAQQDPFRDHSRIPGLDEMQTSLDFEAVAFEKLPRATFDYTAHGAAGEYTVHRNRRAFEWAKLIPRAASGANPIDASTEVLGTKMKFPIMLAPSAAHSVLHPQGEHATYEGATAASETPMIVSYVTSTPFPEIAEKRQGGPLWYQLYPRQDIPANQEPLDAAQQAGAGAIVVTVDQQAPYYERSMHNRNLSESRRPSRPSAEGPARYRLYARRLWYEWKLFDQLRPYIRVPMLAKGVMTADDALRCLDHGVDGIIVSNHGGRALDYSQSSLEVLPEIVDALAGRVPVIVDGGFRRGADVLKGLALGAAAVAFGRVPRWGLAAYGPQGVQRVLEILQAELIQAMAQTGCRDLASAGRSIVRTSFP